MSEVKFVYIAGPYTSDPNDGVRNAIRWADDLIGHGFVPFIPHLCHLWDLVNGGEVYEFYMDYVTAWIPKCDALVRLVGESPGADREVQIARDNHIPVVYAPSKFSTLEVLRSLEEVSKL